jgi:eukaryotic-like serine/threonine-protein kinase
MDATSTGMIGKYQVIRVLGRGGMGEVILAQDDLGRRVAIKRPFKSAMEDGLARFKVEARAATLSHPNIPVVYEMGMEDGLPFIAMEFVEGDPLDKLISSGKPIDLITKLSIIEQVCSGLGHAHQKGIIHRDIKPANVILQPNGVAKIIDFGIAKIQNLEMTSALTQTSQIIGSLHYIAPERFKGEAVDGRVDVFSAGVMLYLLLTGHLPFAGGEATASYRIVNEAHSSLGEHIRDYPPALDEIMDQALAKNPEDRFPTAEDFADALHDVVEELKKTRVFQLFDDAERLTTESRYAPALELLDEAMKLDPANTQVRKLRKFVREHQERQRRAERLREIVVKADEVLGQENYPEALALLKEAQRLDPAFPELNERIQFVEEKKRHSEASAQALADAEAARSRGDITAALRIAERALEADPEHSKLLAMRGALAKQVETEALQRRVVAVLETARRELAAQHYPAVEQLLTEAESIDPSHPHIDEMRRELAKVKEQEERRQLLEELHRRVNEFLRNDNYEQAADLLNRAIEKLPAETTLHRLKVEVDTGARKYGAKQFIDKAIASARELFPTAPLEALAVIQKAIEQMPGEDRLVAYERSLRQQFDTQRTEQLLGDTLRKARELIAERSFDKAISVLESYHLEYGDQPDVDEMLALARNELATKQRRMVVERTTAEVKTLVRDERLDDAVRLLESAIRESNEPALSHLLEEVRGQQTALVRKLEVLQKRVALHRERGELDDAIRLLEEYLATTPKSAPVLELLAVCRNEREHRQVTQEAIANARVAGQRKDYSAGLEALQGVVRAYGETPELTHEIQQLQAARATAATEAVGKSIEAARGALLKNDPNGALKSLKEANDWVEFADAQRQADWRRIGQATKTALQQPDKPVVISDLDEPITIQKKTPVWIFAAGGVAVVAIAVVAVVTLGRKQPAAGPAAPTQSYIEIAKAPAGAQVSIDGGAGQAVDANGDVKIKVQPGQHALQVSKDGFDPFTDTVQVDPGGTAKDNVSLVKSVVAAKAGTVSLQGNLPEFKVSVDGKNRGMMQKGGQLTLEEGQHTIRYANPDDSDFQQHTVQIAAHQNIVDSFTLKAATPKPTMGKLSIQTTAGAQVSVDGQRKGVADGSGNLTIDNLPSGAHSVDIAADNHLPAQGHQVNIVAGQTQSYSAQLALAPPPPPTTGSMEIDSTPGAQVTIDGQPKGTVNGSGKLVVEQLAPGAHSVDLTLDNFKPIHGRSVTITANQAKSVDWQLQPNPVVVAEQPKAAPTPAPAPAGPPDAGTLKTALSATYQSLFTQASGKSSKECQGIFNGFASGGLKYASPWCSDAKQFSAAEKCTEAPSGTPDSATMACTESLTVVMKDGNKITPPPIRRTFHFAKGGDGSWRVVKLD